MKTFRAELQVGDTIIDYFEFETDTKEMAFKHAVSRFEKAYPLYTKKAKFIIIELGEVDE